MQHILHQPHDKAKEEKDGQQVQDPDTVHFPLCHTTDTPSTVSNESTQ
jgi:hypothetical protein